MLRQIGKTDAPLLKGAVTLWSETFPSALDYPAEEHCSSASSGGTGCSTCYSPLMTVEVSPDIATIDALSAVVVAFEAIQGRRLALAFEEHGCQTNRGCSLVGSFGETDGLPRKHPGTSVCLEWDSCWFNIVLHQHLLFLHHQHLLV